MGWTRQRVRGDSGAIEPNSDKHSVMRVATSRDASPYMPAPEIEDDQLFADGRSRREDHGRVVTGQTQGP